MSAEYELTIGLEVHIQLLTRSKAFCADAASFGAAPNTQVSAISLAHPGTLPRLNKKAVAHAVTMGLACGCTISRRSTFDRKNYFYPDLPKGYQITQDNTPICLGGNIKIRLADGTERTIALNRIHMEEDAGKLVHESHLPESWVDLNRAGMPLIELVTEPNLHSAEEAAVFLAEVRKLVRWLEIGDGNMEEGSFRCDANISLRPKGDPDLGKKVEIKNMNSFRYVFHAIEAEAKRQSEILDAGMPVESETRMFDPDSGQTRSMRSKEAMNDYRYFPDPDLLPLVIDEEWFSQIQATIPALPEQLYSRLTGTYNLPAYDAAFLTQDKETAQYFETLADATGHYKAASNWIMGPVRSYLNETGSPIRDFPIPPNRLAELIRLVLDGKLNLATATQQVFPSLLAQPDVSAESIALSLNVFQNSDAEDLTEKISEILKRMPVEVEAYRKGKKALLGLFMGEIKKATQGTADPKLAARILSELL